MSKEQFEQKKADIEAMDENRVKSPNIPIDVALQESEDLYVWCQPDKDQLIKSGLDWKLVDDLPARTGACRYIQSQWQLEFKSLKDVQKLWNLKSPAAYELRDALLHHFYHAYFKFPDLYASTQKIAEGNTHADMIQDLSDLATLGKSNPAPLQTINIDLSMLDRSETLSGEMAILLANANGKKKENNQLCLLRDKAFTHMKDAIDEIRRCGQYVFWRDEQRIKGYTSMFIKKQAAKAEKKVNTKAEKANAS